MDADGCPTKAILLLAWNNAAQIYSRAVAELSANIGTLSKDDYERMSQKAEQARQWSIEAQASFEAHVEDHGCESDEAAA